MWLACMAICILESWIRIYDNKPTYLLALMFFAIGCAAFISYTGYASAHIIPPTIQYPILEHSTVIPLAIIAIWLYKIIRGLWTR